MSKPFFINIHKYYDEFYHTLCRADFQLTDTGDIFWSLPAGVTTKPYFVKNFDLYEVRSGHVAPRKFIQLNYQSYFTFLYVWQSQIASYVQYC